MTFRIFSPVVSSFTGCTLGLPYRDTQVSPEEVEVRLESWFLKYHVVLLGYKFSVAERTHGIHTLYTYKKSFKTGKEYDTASGWGYALKNVQRYQVLYSFLSKVGPCKDALCLQISNDYQCGWKVLWFQEAQSLFTVGVSCVKLVM